MCNEGYYWNNKVCYDKDLNIVDCSSGKKILKNLVYVLKMSVNVKMVLLLRELNAMLMECKNVFHVILDFIKIF